ncbi:CHAT domain-containing protein [Olleya sp. HaHaR_3_96]|uniref:CHAT domain-containing protein n=1 Tax=Olleya sp. HaHaR_3_96 TaxID=2745560 RepID=UPI001C4F37CB|nr:CHAT domain-containing protein [Olleya sp. HaHaR_3_96]QXP61041.1 CHAT domain-containing protein [Olleya sp. HaHaR_3_96]
MKYNLIILFFLVFGNLLSQELEETIYVATETFNAKRTSETYNTFLKNETYFKSNSKTKDDYFAYLFFLVSKANYLDSKNQQTSAISVYEDALNLYNSQKLSTVFEYDITEYCLKPLGVLYNKIGDYTNAENTIKQYTFLAEKQQNAKHRISGAINLAQLYYTVGKFESSKSIVKKGLEIKGITNVQKQKLIQINTNSQIALKQITSNKDIPTKSQIDSYEVTSLETKYNIAVNNKNFEEALKYSTKLIDKASENSAINARNLAKLHVKNAQLHYKLNDFETSLKALKSAIKLLLPNTKQQQLPIKEDLYPENTFIDIFDLLAEMQPNYNTALAYYNLSFYVSDLLTKNLTSQDAKLLHLTANRRRSESCINLLFDVYQSTKDSTIAIQAFAYAEKNKSTILKETISKKTLLQLHRNDSLLINEQSLLRKQERLTNSLIKAQYQKDANQINTLSQDLTTASSALKQLKIKIDKAYPKTNTSNISIKKLKHKLDKNKAILAEYFYGNTAIFQFIISAESIDFIKIKKTTDLDNAINDYINYFDNSSAINNNISAFTTDAFQLYQLLHFKNTSAYQNVVIIPDGFLNFIPFESLLSLNTSTTSYSKMPFVAKKQILAYNTSAFLYLNTHPFEYDASVLGVFPVFDNSNSKLTYSINEAESIAKHIDAKFLMYDNATKKDALLQAKNYGILHLSTHASSGTFRVPANIDFIDEKLFLNELYSVNLSNKLVVLSACETGIGKLQKGEGSMNMARGFQYAGVENLLFSLWKINDLSTSKLMASFYKNYSKTHSAFIANHLSKIDYLNNPEISNIKKSPYYWSAFTYYGDLTPITVSNYSKYIVFTIIGLAIALLLWFIIRRRHNEKHA